MCIIPGHFMAQCFYWAIVAQSEIKTQTVVISLIFYKCVHFKNNFKFCMLVENVRTRQLRFLGHVLRMPDDEPCKEYALYIPPHGKRKPGRQQTLFLRYIQHLLGDTDNMIGPGKLSELALDRCGWRKLVVACSAADQ